MSATFHPVPDTFGGFAMPPSVPDGLSLQLSRAKLLDGAEAEFDSWMQTLHDRYDECVASLAKERAAFEATFLSREADGSLWMYHVSLVGQDSPGLDTTTPIGQSHQAHAMRTKHRGWEELEARFMLAPPHIGEAMARWAQTGRP